MDGWMAPFGGKMHKWKKCTQNRENHAMNVFEREDCEGPPRESNEKSFNLPYLEFVN